MTYRKQLKVKLAGAIWDTNLESLPWWKARLLRVARMFTVVLRDVTEGQLTLRATSLVYTTLLALVPLLAVSFSILKSFGVHNQIEPLLRNFLEPLGEKGTEITSRVIGFVDNVEAGVLGSVGLILLIYTVISLIQKIEEVFNYTWHVKRTRSFAQRFSHYLSVIVVGPVLVFSALGITASVMSTTVVQKLVGIEPFGSLLKMAGQLVPYLLTITAFAFIYTFVPNIKVRLGSALTGATVAGVLWQATGWAFAAFIASSTKYTAIYSSFAILILFMIWIYLSWLILLVGASIAFYHQHPESLTPYSRRLSLNNRLKEHLSLLVMLMIGQNYYHRRPAWTLEGLAQHLSVPMVAVEPILSALEERGLLTRTRQDPPTYLPCRPPETTGLKEVLDAVRTTPQQADSSLGGLRSAPGVEHLLESLDRAVAEALRGRTIKELVRSDPPPDGEPAAPSTGEQGAAPVESPAV
jgi:membrane protein